MLRAVADHDLAAGQVERQEGFDILLDGETPDIKMDRARQVDQRRRLIGQLARPEQPGIDAARPPLEMHEPTAAQVGLDRGRRHHRRLRRAMEASQPGIGEAQGQAEAGRDIFGKARVIGGRERQSTTQAITPRRQAERPFGRNVNGVGCQGVKPCRHAPIGKQGQAYLRVGRARHRAEGLRRDDGRAVPSLL
jgi:hypothetical protein